MSSIDFWRSSQDKDDPEVFEEEIFRYDYIEQELPQKVKLVRSLIQRPLKSAIMSTDNESYQVLSLGCGPGSDILAVLEVFQSVCATAGLDRLRVSCTGVDLYRWPLHEFDRRKSAMERQGPIRSIGSKFKFKTNMEDWVWRTDAFFDIIILSFAGAKSRIDFIGSKLPRLLREDGRIFVIDNNISAVRGLQDFGFRRVGPRNNGRVTCLMYTAQTDSSE